MKSRRACFFAKVRDVEELERVDFYAQDIAILARLGYKVSLSTMPWEFRPADLYYGWWWTWAFAPVSFARIVGSPVILTGVFNERLYDVRPRLQRSLIDFAVHDASANVAVSQLEYQNLCRRYPRAKWHYSPLVVDTDLFKPDGCEREEYVYTTATMISDNAIRKCIPELIRSAPVVRARHGSVHFVLAGEVDAAYVRLADDIGASEYVHFLGKVSLADKLRHLQRCSVYLQPSRFEGFGLAILEALSAGAPVVTSDVGAVRETTGDAAVFADGTSPDSIAAEVCRLLDNPRMRMDISQCGRERAVALFGLDRRYRDLSQIIEASGM
jgi:glycosyltransferase involved in cell wall biosynthesis